MVYTLSGGFVWVFFFVNVIMASAPVAIVAFLKHPISSELVKMMPVSVDKIPYLALLVMIKLIYLPNFGVIFYSAIFRKGGYDNNSGRVTQPAFLKTHPIAQRLKAAHYNAIENLPVFLTTLFIAISLKTDELYVAKISVFYILMRSLYVVFYFLNLDLFRSCVFSFSFMAIIFMGFEAVVPEFNLIKVVDGFLSTLPVKLEL